MNASESKERATPGEDKGGVAALERAFAILAAFRSGEPALTLAELAERTGLYKSTILRLAQSLLAHRFLQRLDDGRYRIGPGPFLLGALYQRNLKLGEVLLPVMRELAGLSGESVSFYVRDGNARVCLHRVDSMRTVRDHVTEGDVLPLEHGSGGRVLAAFSGAPGAPYDGIRRDCFYASFGERDPDTAGVSAPVFGAGQRLMGALTVAGPRSRIDHAFVQRARVPLLDAAIRASFALGGDTQGLDTARSAITQSGDTQAA